MSTHEAFTSWLGRFVLGPLVLLILVVNYVAWPLAAERFDGAMVMGARALLLVASIGIGFFVLKAAQASATESFLGGSRDATEAGRWAVSRVLGSLSRIDGNTYDDEEEPSGPLVDQLETRWQSLQQEMKDLLTPQSEEVRRDLELAKEFQLAYLNRPYPKIPAVHVQGRLRLEFCHRYEPALALGGDFFDVLKLGNDCAGVFVADVMGHGTRSALITAVIRTLIADLTSQGRNAPHFIRDLNRQICGFLRILPHPLFASAFYFVIDTTARAATFTSAGHPAPFHLRRSLGKVTRLEVPEPRGAALGLLPDEEYSGESCRLIPGDVFLFFTDGVYEACNDSGEEFGLHRMESAIVQTLYKPAKIIIDHILAEVTKFVGEAPLSDDICIVAAEVTTAEAPRDTRA